MNVGILGSGDVAKSLGKGFISRRHAVMLGTRDSSKLADWQKENPAARVGSFSDAAAFGEIVALATLGTAAVDAIDQAGRRNFAGKIVIVGGPPVNCGSTKC